MKTLPLDSPDEQRLTLRKPLAICAILILSAVLGTLASPQTIFPMVGVFAGIAVLLVIAGRPVWGLYALLPVAFFGRWEINTGTKVPLNPAFLLPVCLIALWVLRMLVIEREVRLFPSRLNTPALLFVIVTSLSLLAGNIRWIPGAVDGAKLHAQLGAWGLYVLPMGILLLAGNRVRDLACLRRLVWLFLGLGGFYIAGRIIPGLAFIRLSWFVPTPYLGSMFWVWLVALALGQSLYNDELRPGWRACLALLVTAALYTSWVHSRAWFSGWLPALAALFVLVWLHSGVSRLALMAGCAGFISLFSADLYQAMLAATQEHSAITRQATYPILFELIKASPILGLGPANYYHYTLLYPLLGWYVRFSSHNNYLDILAQTGLVGLALFSWLAAEIFRLAWRLRRQAPDGFSRGYVYAVLAGLTAMLVSGFMGDWFLPFVYNIGISGFRASLLAWLFLGGLLALERIHDKRLPDNG